MVIAALVCSHLEAENPSITLKGLDLKLQKEIYRDYKNWCHQKKEMCECMLTQVQRCKVWEREMASLPGAGVGLQSGSC